MKTVSEREIIQRIRLENPWWAPPHQIDETRFKMQRRSYFDLFFPYVKQRDPRRAMILMGPRRVGKTVLLHQAIQSLLDEGVSPNHIGYLDLQTPLYNGLSLERLLRLCQTAAAAAIKEPFYLFFDEVQYFRGWEVHLKNLVDVWANVKFIASGSAAAALRLKSAESGAGRFTDFLLPPITFCEYIQLLGDGRLVSAHRDGETNWIKYQEIDILNQRFFDYLNAGGYPEAIFSPTVQSDFSQYIRSDIIDKVLMKDLPSLYGIHDIQELNSLFTMLAYNSGSEISLDALSTNAGVAKNTIKRYVEYLESAFLIKQVHRIDRSAKRFKRANFFKAYLANPCIRSALFAPVSPDDEAAGSLVETAILAQWFHWLHVPLYYARWDKGSGEVDMVWLSRKDFTPTWACEIKWSDAYVRDLRKLKSLKQFLAKHPGCQAYLTTRSKASGDINLGSALIQVIPSSVYCYYVGWYVFSRKRDATIGVSLLKQEPPS